MVIKHLGALMTTLKENPSLGIEESLLVCGNTNSDSRTELSHPWKPTHEQQNPGPGLRTLASVAAFAARGRKRSLRFAQPLGNPDYIFSDSWLDRLERRKTRTLRSLSLNRWPRSNHPGRNSYTLYVPKPVQPHGS